MGWPAKNDKTRNLGSYDLRIVRYKKLQKKILGIRNSFSLLRSYKMTF